MYDMYTPLSETDHKFTYEKPAESLRKSWLFWVRIVNNFEPMVKAGKDWCSHENQGKRSNISARSYDTNAFMLLNYGGHGLDLFYLGAETGLQYALQLCK